MSNLYRYIHGDTKPIRTGPVPADTDIEIGQLVTKGLTIAAAAADVPNFLGIAQQQSRAGDVDPIRIATSGTFRLPVVEGEYALGDPLTLSGDPDRWLEAGALDTAVAVVAEDSGGAVTTVKARVLSRVIPAAAAAPAPTA